MDRGAWQVHGFARVGHDLVTKPPLIVWYLKIWQEGKILSLTMSSKFPNISLI